MRLFVAIILVCGTNVKKLKALGKLYVFFVSNCTIKVKILENDGAKPITHAANLVMFPDIEIDNLSFEGSSCLELIFLIRCELFIYGGYTVVFYF